MSGPDRYYIGENDCKVATCPHKQEFPDAEDPYCIRHSLGKYFSEVIDQS